MSAQPEPARFHAAEQVVAAAFALLRVPERLSVSEAAERYRVLDNPGGGISGPWTFDLLPFLRRPMDCLGLDSGYSMVAFMGPSQCGKSSIGDNWCLWGVICDPADMLLVGPDKDIMRSYSITQIDRMIRACPDMRRRQLPTASADNIFSKQFQGGTLFIVWPVKAQLRARPIPRCRVDDYDAVPEDIDGEGNVLVLLSGRQTTFEGSQMTYVNSSPALGADRGIEATVTGGTDERWWVRCLQCDAPFELCWDHVQYDRTGTPEDAATTVSVVCPDCGHPHEPADKRALMQRGTWVGAGQTLLDDGSLTGDRRQTSVASFRIEGLAGMASWPSLAEQYRRAEITFEITQDEENLRSVVQSLIGRNYVSRLAGAKPVTKDGLIARAEASGYALGQAPDWVVCLTAGVDVQGNRFEVIVVGWGAGLEHCVVDRFPILALEGGDTAIDPSGHAEHWSVLLHKVLWRRYPIAGKPGWSLAVCNTAIDTGGEDGVTDNAFSFWHTAIGAGVPPTAVTLIKGGSNPKAKLLPPPTVDTKRRLKGHPDPELFVPNVNRLKGIINARMHRAEPGPAYLHLPTGMDPAHIAELTAEHKVKGLWTRKSGERNESWDCLVYATTALMRHGGSDTALNWVPDWARPVERPASERRSPESEIVVHHVRAKKRSRIRIRGGR